MVQITHNVIGDTAKAIAREAYESIAHDNAFYAEWPTMDAFVAANFQMFVPQAREALLKILAGDYPEAMKQPIYEALLIDGELKGAPNRHERRARTKVIGSLH